MNKNTSDAIKAGVFGAVMGLIISFLANYYVIPFPETVFSNAMGNGVSGFLSGFMGGFMGLLMYLKQTSKAQ